MPTIAIIGASTSPHKYGHKAVRAYAESAIKPQVTSWDGRSPSSRPKKPTISAPSAGANTVATWIIAQPFIRLMSSTSMLPRLRK